MLVFKYMSLKINVNKKQKLTILVNITGIYEPKYYDHSHMMWIVLIVLLKTVHDKIWNILDGKPTFDTHGQCVECKRNLLIRVKLLWPDDRSHGRPWWVPTENGLKREKAWATKKVLGGQDLSK